METVILRSKDFPVLMCCKDDMCNYKDLEKYNIQIRSNGSTQRGEKDSSGSYSVPYSRDDIPEENSPEKDLWFKAAVIAVPIAGGFILVLLVLLAVRMLRTDTRRSRQLIQFRRERTSLTKAQLYVTDHFSSHKKPEKNSSFFGEKYNSLCKESNTNNIKVDKDGKIYEKVSDKSKRHTPSLIVWGKPSKSDFATIV
ncbi:hypothetical protein KUTeg_008273 [Tegillarca granosa]|uniref:BMP and activin membrane-bound inhibitor C-terminal domain-containing protein n=1 Tax=Tegillarca granosa TaxID=220873 RepID=A0ABQ9FBG8_TEGGR|nr:hypothetical protein KUTeg_008273 [Tegillarca granosa]